MVHHLLRAFSNIFSNSCAAVDKTSTDTMRRAVPLRCMSFLSCLLRQADDWLLIMSYEYDTSPGHEVNVKKSHLDDASRQESNQQQHWLFFCDTSCRYLFFISYNMYYCFAPGRITKYCDLRVCLPVCPLARISQRNTRNMLYMLGYV